MRKLVKLSGGVSLLAAVAISIGGAGVLHPAAHSAHYQPLMSGASVPQEVSDIIGRACQDCHSDKTEWPWYSRVPPMSMLIAKDVEEGRQFMNLSSWASYSKGRKIGYLVAMSSATAKGEMPPRRYTVIHDEAKLSDGDRRTIADWAMKEMMRLQRGIQPR
jgi:hypothetical protein